MINTILSLPIHVTKVIVKNKCFCHEIEHKIPKHIKLCFDQDIKCDVDNRDDCENELFDYYIAHGHIVYDFNTNE